MSDNHASGGRMSVNQYTAPWSEEKIALLKKLWEEKASCRAIGRELGVSHNSVASKVRQLELPMRRPSSSTKLGSGRPVAAKARRPASRPVLRSFSGGGSRTEGRQNPISPGRLKPPEPLQRSNFNPTFSFGKKPSAPPSLTSDQKEYILGKGISLMELKHDSCRWPINEPKRDGEYLFCGATIGAKGYSYCEYHTRKAYGPPIGKVNLSGMRHE
jgi:GcrA cell cycle regulator